MRESANSLRWFFGVVGILPILGFGAGYYLLHISGLSSFFAQIFAGSPLAILSTILSFIWSLGYLYFALKLPRYLNPQSVRYVQIFLILPFTHTVLSSAVTFFTTGTVSYFVLIVGALILWYLLTNVSRLAKSSIPVAQQSEAEKS